jgi:hypothetical protein
MEKHMAYIKEYKIISQKQEFSINYVNLSVNISLGIRNINLA